MLVVADRLDLNKPRGAGGSSGALECVQAFLAISLECLPRPPAHCSAWQRTVVVALAAGGLLGAFTGLCPSPALAEPTPAPPTPKGGGHWGGGRL